MKYLNEFLNEGLKDKFLNLFKKKDKDEKVKNTSVSGTYEVTKSFHDGFKNYFDVGDKISIDYEVTYPNRKDKKYEHYAIYHMPIKGEDLNMEIFNANNQENYDSVLSNLKKISDKSDDFR